MTFQIAVNLAQADESRDSKGWFQVKRDHIKVTVDLLKDFGNYMLKTQTMSPRKNAEIAKVRFDAFQRDQQLG
ncbi:hypothetical protein N0V94_005938 [Neodidymelliopsis sp. IMI 364377]|nr:hypothetical protein N0V94_005938 [Neodidymelliopsis sp. IMI 364377]